MALPIRQRLSALTCLKAGPKAVLIEVCELHANGGKGCYASNGHLAKKLGTSERSITRALAELEIAGYLTSNGQGKARALTPSAAVAAAYQPGATGETAAANLDKPSQIGEVGEVDNLDKNGNEPSQKWQPNLAKNGSQPSQKASRVYGDDQDDQYNDQDDQPAALSLAQKKIEGLAFELAEALEDLTACRATITDLRAQLETEKKKGGATRVATLVAALPYTSEEFAAKWQAFRISHGIAQGSARESALLESLQGIAATDEATALSCLKKSIEMGWKTFYKPDEPRPQYSQQSERGAKPTAAAATGARALAERLAVIDEEQRQQRLHGRSGGAAAGAYTGQMPG